MLLLFVRSLTLKLDFSHPNSLSLSLSLSHTHNYMHTIHGQSSGYSSVRVVRVSGTVSFSDII